MRAIFVQLSESDLKALLKIEIHGKYYLARRKAKALRLSHQGFTKNKICELLQVSLKTVKNWFYGWRDFGMAFVKQNNIKGRTPIITDPVVLDFIMEQTRLEPRQIRFLIELLKIKFEIIISLSTLKRYIKKNEMAADQK